MFSLKNRVVVISGASSGLGAQMARGFAAQGADLVITARRIEKLEALAEEIRKFVDKTRNCYILDFRKYAPVYDQKFKDTFMLGHMTPAGYLLTAKMVMSYIDYIIRNNPDDFSQVGFIGTPYKYRKDLIQNG